MVGRPRTDPEELEAQALNRIASLASSIMETLRKPDRGSYSSENGLRQMLADDGVSFSASDLVPALDLLTSTGRPLRPVVAPNLPRPGWIALHAPEEASEPLPSAGDVQAKAVIRALQPGNGGSHRCQVDELSERLASDGVTCIADELSDVLVRWPIAANAHGCSVSRTRLIRGT